MSRKNELKIVGVNLIVLGLAYLPGIIGYICLEGLLVIAFNVLIFAFQVVMALVVSSTPSLRSGSMWWTGALSAVAIGIVGVMLQNGHMYCNMA